MKKGIVCGTRFGQFYIEALKKMENVEMVGIFAHGSKRSRDCAEYYGLNLYTDIGEIPENIDFACVAIKSEVMGGNGTEVSLELMKRGINVIFEQPMHLKGTAECFKYAMSHGVKFLIGNLYANLPAVKKFIKNVNLITAKEKPLYINIDFATQVSYPLIHILTEILPAFRNWNVLGEVKEASPFQVLVIMADGIEVTFRAHNQIDKVDIDGYLHLFYQISVGFSGGRLTLLDPHGSVIWQPRVHFPKEDIIPAKLCDITHGSMVEKNTFVLYDSTITQKQIFTELWSDTIIEDVERLFGIIDNENRIEENKRVQKQLLRCQEWQQLMSILGYPQIVEKCEYNYLPNSILDRSSQCMDNVSLIRNGIGYLNRACYITMIFYLQEKLSDDEIAGSCEIKEIIGKMEISEVYEEIIERWFRILAEENYLTILEEQCYFEVPRISNIELSAAWQEAEENWNEKMGPDSILTYFRKNGMHLREIMEGKINPALLLFPEGTFEMARDLYSGTAIANYLNGIIAKTIAQMSNIQSKLILEIGAGTGATTEKICAELASDNSGCKEYIFSDLSDFFLIEAKRRYDIYPWMRYEKIDIDNDFGNIGLKDIVIAVGVINNAVDILAVLKKIADILNPGGHLFLVEAVGESVSMLISQAFMMKKTDDSRKTENITFLNLKQWYELFEKSGFKIIRKMPDKSSELSVYNQKLFILQKN